MNTSNSAAAGNSSLQLRCPKCEHSEAQLFVSSKSVVTVHCASCRHPWSLEITALPTETKQQLQRLMTK